MPSPVRTLFVAFQFAALAAFLIFGTTLTVVPVLASPIPMPMPSAIDSLDFVTPRSIHNASNPTLTNESQTLDEPDSSSRLSRRQNTAVGNLNLLNNYVTSMNQHAQNFNKLYRRANTASASGSGFQQQCAYELTGFQENLASFQSLAAQMGSGTSDKGLANYDSSNTVETLLKDMINANKYILNDTYDMTQTLPILGTTLGPIVYEIKCILDEILDAVEDMTDEILNSIQPLLQSLIETATAAACSLEVAGLCISP